MIEPLELRRLMAAQFLDTDFGSGGVVTLRFKATADNPVSFTRMAVDGDGRTYVLARTTTSAQIRRLDADGQVDATWFPKKRNLLLFPYASSFNSLDIKVDSADRLVFLNGQDVYRFTEAGDVDRTFAGDGSFKLGDFTNSIGLSIDASNRIYATGVDKARGGMLVERLISRGRFDKSFGGDGRVTVPLPPAVAALDGASGYGRHVQAVRTPTTAVGDDLVMVAGVVSGIGYGSGAQAALLKEDGSRVVTYGRRGFAYVLGGVNSDTSSSFVSPSAILADGSVSLSGFAQTGGAGSVNTAAVFLPSGLRVRASNVAFDSVPDGRGGLIVNTARGVISTQFFADGEGGNPFNAGRPILNVNDMAKDDDSLLLLSASYRAVDRVSVAKFTPAIYV